MAGLPGVRDVAYDCKTATVRMNGDARLTEPAALAVLTRNGFTLTKFSEGAAPTVTAYVVQIDRMPTAKRDAVEQVLRSALPKDCEVSVDSTGFATVVPSGPQQPLTQDALTPALAGTGCSLASLEQRTWPPVCALYDVEMRGVEPAAWPKVRDALSGLDKVLTAQVFSEKDAVLLRLKEPCSQIETRVRESATTHGYQVTAFSLRAIAKAH